MYDRGLKRAGCTDFCHRSNKVLDGTEPYTDRCLDIGKAVQFALFYCRISYNEDVRCNSRYC